MLVFFVYIYLLNNYKKYKSEIEIIYFIIKLIQKHMKLKPMHFYLFISLHISPNEYKKDKYETWIHALYLLAYI